MGTYRARLAVIASEIAENFEHHHPRSKEKYREVAMVKTCIHPDFLFESVNRWGFSQIVTTQGGKTVWLSGQTPWDASEKPHGTTRRAQMKTCVANIKRAVEAAGGKLDDVVSLRLYMPNYQPSEWEDVAAGLKENFPGPNPPATTWIGITSLASADYLIEIEAFAVISE